MKEKLIALFKKVLQSGSYYKLYHDGPTWSLLIDQEDYWMYLDTINYTTDESNRQYLIRLTNSKDNYKAEEKISQSEYQDIHNLFIEKSNSNAEKMIDRFLLK